MLLKIIEFKRENFLFFFNHPDLGVIRQVQIATKAISTMVTAMGRCIKVRSISYLIQLSEVILWNINSVFAFHLVSTE